MINNNRRTFLQGAALTGVAAVTPISASTAIQTITDKLERAEFALPDFSAFVGDSVSIKTADGLIVDAIIAEVSDMQCESKQHKRPAYLRACAKVVRFKVAEGKQFVNDVHQVEHAQLGKMDLLLSAVPNADGVIALEAVFN